MSDDINWNEAEPVEVPTGRFVGWGKIGQTITGDVVKYADEGSTDFNGAPCPLLVLELVDAADNYRDKGATLERLEAGELVSISAGQVNLARRLRAASLTPGDVVRIAWIGTFKGTKGDVKDFEVKVARGARRRDEPAGLFSES
jgi:hypothetical protein